MQISSIRTNNIFKYDQKSYKKQSEHNNANLYNQISFSGKSEESKSKSNTKLKSTLAGTMILMTLLNGCAKNTPNSSIISTSTASTKDPQKPTSQENLYTIQKGDNLSKIVKKYLGDSAIESDVNTWVKKIAIKNGIENPSLITVGQQLDLSELIESTKNTITSEDLKGLSEEEVIQKVAPLFIESKRNTGIPTSIQIAQFLLETNAGQSELFQNSNNGFGMKTKLSNNNWENSSWDGESVYSINTSEEINGKKTNVNATFRKYKDFNSSISDHNAYLLGAKNENQEYRYRIGLTENSDITSCAKALCNGGYATDSEYLKKLLTIISKYKLDEYDEGYTNYSYIIKDGDTYAKITRGLLGLDDNSYPKTEIEALQKENENKPLYAGEILTYKSIMPSSRTYSIPEAASKSPQATYIEFEPTKDGTLTGKTIFLNAGHGGLNPESLCYDSGAANNGIKECDLNANYVSAILDKLRENGATVVVTQGQVKSLPETFERFKTEHKSEIDNNALFLSIHFNSVNPNLKGFSVLYGTRNNSFDFAKTIKEKLINNDFKPLNDGLIEHENFAVIRQGEDIGLDSVMLEVACLSNTEELNEALKYNTQLRTSKAIFDAIESYFT